MSTTINSDGLTVGIAQISPVWLNREKTLDKIIAHVDAAAEQACQLVVFGEALLPGYHPIDGKPAATVYTQPGRLIQFPSTRK